MKTSGSRSGHSGHSGGSAAADNADAPLGGLGTNAGGGQSQEGMRARKRRRRSQENGTGASASTSTLTSTSTSRRSRRRRRTDLGLDFFSSSQESPARFGLPARAASGNGAAATTSRRGVGTGVSNRPRRPTPTGVTSSTSTGTSGTANGSASAGTAAASAAIAADDGAAAAAAAAIAVVDNAPQVRKPTGLKAVDYLDAIGHLNSINEKIVALVRENKNPGVEFSLFKINELSHRQVEKARFPRIYLQVGNRSFAGEKKILEAMREENLGSTPVTDEDIRNASTNRVGEKRKHARISDNEAVNRLGELLNWTPNDALREWVTDAWVLGNVKKATDLRQNHCSLTYRTDSGRKVTTYTKRQLTTFFHSYDDTHKDTTHNAAVAASHAAGPSNGIPAPTSGRPTNIGSEQSPESPESPEIPRFGAGHGDDSQEGGAVHVSSTDGSLPHVEGTFLELIVYALFFPL